MIELNPLRAQVGITLRQLRDKANTEQHRREVIRMHESNPVRVRRLASL